MAEYKDVYSPVGIPKSQLAAEQPLTEKGWTHQQKMPHIRQRRSPKKMVKSEVAQSCPTLCDSMDCSLPGSPVHGIFQARTLKWVAISFSRRSSQPRDQTQVSLTAGRVFTIWVIREAQQDGRRSKIMFTIKLHTHQRSSEGANKTVCAPGPRERSYDLHKRFSQTCLWVSGSLQWRGWSTMACCRISGTEYNSPGINSFEGGIHWPQAKLQGGNTAPSIRRK